MSWPLNKPLRICAMRPHDPAAVPEGNPKIMNREEAANEGAEEGTHINANPDTTTPGPFGVIDMSVKA
jgi:hypothetical protein